MGHFLEERPLWEYEFSLVIAVGRLLWMTYTLIVIFWCFLLTLMGKMNKESFFRYYVTVSVGVLFLATEVALSKGDDGLADWIQGKDPKLNDLIQQTPYLRQGPSPPWFLRNRHLQFLPFLIQNEIHRREGIPFQREHVKVSNLPDKMLQKDENATSFTDTITIDIFPPFHENETTYGQNFNESSPVIFFIPGLRCDSQDMPGNAIIRKAWSRGFRSIVVNRRGHTPNQPLASPRWNLFGDVEDMEQVYNIVRQRFATDDTPFFLHGLSSGTALVVTALAKWDRQRTVNSHVDTPVFVGAISIAPGYDISKVLSRERFLWPYNDILLERVKEHFVLQNEPVLRSHDSDAVDQVLAASNLQEIVDAAVTFAGYKNASSYYEDTNPVIFMQDITTPMLVLNAVDDPCCNIQNLYEKSPYQVHKGQTFDQVIGGTERAIVAVSKTGSHIPFLCTRNRWLPITKDPFGSYMIHSWADQVSLDFYEAALNVYGDRRFRS